ncbi:MAG: ycgR 2 [Firmicutes bacterium]|nr:ycgR 2 [Bacillota bacterium]
MTQGDSVARYSSRIEEITEQYLYLAMPMDKGVPVLLFTKVMVRGRLIVDSNVWEFNCKYVDKVASPIPMWIVEKPTELIKIQLRDFVRFKTLLPIDVSVIDDEGKPGELLRASTKDISGGGICIATRRELFSKDKVKMTITFPEGGIVEAVGLVIRVTKPQDLDVYWSAIKFIIIKERDREAIIKYIFKKQSQQRRLE